MVRAWKCERLVCGHEWIAAGKLPPKRCAKCKRTDWHVTLAVVELLRESGAGLDDRIAEIARRVFAEEWARVPADPVDTITFVQPEILPPGPVNMAALRDICAGNVRVPLATPLEPSSAPLVREPCSYTEWDEQLGETFRCGLMAHPPKVKHTRGAKV